MMKEPAGRVTRRVVGVGCVVLVGWAVSLGGCGKSSSKQKPAAEVEPAAAAVAAPAAATAVQISLAATATWGEVSAESQGATTRIIFEMEPTRPAVVRAPAGAKVALLPPGSNEAAALAAEAYSFELVAGAKGKKAAGFVFETKESLDRDVVKVAVRPGEKAGSYAIELSAGKRHLERTMEREGECNLKACEACKQTTIEEHEAFEPGVVGASIPGAKEAFAALSKELEGRAKELEDPGIAVLVAAQFLGRTLINVDRLRRGAGAALCGADQSQAFEANLAYKCDHAVCKVKQAHGAMEMKRGDDLTFGPGGEIEFVAFED